MAVRQLKDGRWESRYPSHRNKKGKISYRTKIVGYSKRKAERHYREHYSDFMEREILGIPHDPEKAREYSLSELLHWYLGLDKVKALRSYKDIVGRTRSLKKFFQYRKASELLPSDVESYQVWRKKQNVCKHNTRKKQTVCRKKVSNATVNREVSVLKRCFKLAIREKLLQENPCMGVESLKEKERNRICACEEFEALKKELHANARDVVVLAYHTGMRIGEILGLEWRRVDFKNRLIHLRGEDTKNGESRKVPFLNKEVDELLWRRGRDPRRIYGKVFGVNCIRNPFERACRKLGIKNLRMHDFRHTAATNMRKAGIDTTVVMKICGWKSVQMFLRYNEVDDSDLQKANVVGIV
jgi:integrase